MQSSQETGPNQDAFPFIYALLPNKCKSTYLDFFEAIKNVSKVPLNPEYVIIDFEIAVLEARFRLLNSVVTGFIFPKIYFECASIGPSAEKPIG
jgi:hypothetical protein